MVVNTVIQICTSCWFVWKKEKGETSGRHLGGGRGPGSEQRVLHLQTFLLLMHFFHRDLQTGGEVPEVTLGGLLSDKAIAEQLTISVHLTSHHEGYDEGWEEAEEEAEEEMEHGVRKG
jgi:hypothetical protein